MKKIQAINRMQKFIEDIKKLIIPAVLHSYSVIFFLNNKSLAILLLLSTLFNIYAGISGLISVIFAVLIAYFMGFDNQQLKQGLYSFNALLIGIGLGTFFDQNMVFYSILLVASLLTLILSVTFSGWLGKYGLPVLSIPFVLTYWFVALPSSQFENLGLTHRNIFWTNELYSIGGDCLLSLYQYIDNFPLNELLNTYLRSLSSIFFQENIVTGFIIVIVLLISSRIIFSLSIIGFLSAYFFADFTGSAAASMTYYNIGANYMMVSIAIGGFFLIPSKFSYLWSVLLIPPTTIVLLFVNKLFGFIQLPVFSLPFSLIVILFVYFLNLRIKSKYLIITAFQSYSPEINLYSYNNNNHRLSHLKYYPLYLPFWGEWTVSQGHNGQYTHIGNWACAFDFVITDNEQKSFTDSGNICEHYYCYKKPILAPADGIIEEIIDGIDDNEISKINTENNWGNTIIIKHINGLYTQLSHLKKGSIKVTKGQLIKRGEIIALCGNSGRSPEPHLHYQVQALPIIGAKPIDYPFAYYSIDENGKQALKQFEKPEEKQVVSSISENILLKDCFNIYPNAVFQWKYTDTKGKINTENWEAFTDANNQKYLFCKETNDSAYYIFDNSVFYFTAYYGNKKSLLYYFYLSAYKILLSDFGSGTITDGMPLNTSRKYWLQLWLNDFCAPFFSFLNIDFASKIIKTSSQQIDISSYIQAKYWGRNYHESESEISIVNSRIHKFVYKSHNVNISAICTNS